MFFHYFKLNGKWYRLTKEKWDHICPSIRLRSELFLNKLNRGS